MIILTLTSTEKSFHRLFEGTTWNFRGERGICDYGKTRGADIVLVQLPTASASIMHYPTQ